MSSGGKMVFRLNPPLRHAKRYPWQPCDWESARQAAPPGTFTLKNSVTQTVNLPNPILIWNPQATTWVGTVGQESAKIQSQQITCDVQLIYKLNILHNGTCPARTYDWPTDHILSQTRSLQDSICLSLTMP